MDYVYKNRCSILYILPKLAYLVNINTSVEVQSSVRSIYFYDFHFIMKKYEDVWTIHKNNLLATY